MPPEATAEALERPAPGIAEAIRADAIRKTPHGLLSRGAAGVRGRSLVVNLPGSPGLSRRLRRTERAGHRTRAGAARDGAGRGPPANVIEVIDYPRRFASLVKLEHTVFALPYAYVGAILAVDGWPGSHDLGWITVAMVGARSFAMGPSTAWWMPPSMRVTRVPRGASFPRARLKRRR